MCVFCTRYVDYVLLGSAKRVQINTRSDKSDQYLVLIAKMAQAGFLTLKSTNKFIATLYLNPFFLCRLASNRFQPKNAARLL